MQVQLSEFQTNLILMAVNNLVGQLPIPADKPADAMTETLHLIRFEAANLTLMLNEAQPPADRHPRNTFRETPEKVA